MIDLPIASIIAYDLYFYLADKKLTFDSVKVKKNYKILLFFNFDVSLFIYMPINF